jgi:YggT family protein
MSIVFVGVYIALQVFIIIMWIRLILDFVVSMNREFRPRGFGLVVAEVVFTVTDPPIKAVRRVVPPLRIGNVAIDLSWSIVMLLAIVIGFVVIRLA